MSQPNNCKSCKKLEAQRKVGWRSYFQTQELLFEALRTHTQQLREIQRLTEEAKMEIPTHFKEELVKSLKELECPICYDEMTMETFTLTKCFHKLCKPCLEKLRMNGRCPICRTNL